LQAVLAAGAEVRVEVDGRSCGVIEVREHGEEMLVCCITADSPAEQQVVVSPFTPFSVVFSEF